MMQRRRICVIDDDVVLLGALAVSLREAGYDVMTAPGAAAGFDLIVRQGADLILTDMSMPGTDGVQLIAQARRRWPQMPIVAISGKSEVDGKPAGDAARMCGADAFLAKPVQVSDLSAAIADVLAHETPASASGGAPPKP